jgi:hypothetical protein
MEENERLLTILYLTKASEAQSTAKHAPTSPQHRAGPQGFPYRAARHPRHHHQPAHPPTTMDPILPDRMTVELLRQRLLQAGLAAQGQQPSANLTRLPTTHPIGAGGSGRLYAGAPPGPRSGNGLLFPAPAMTTGAGEGGESMSSRLSALRQLDWSRLQRRQERHAAPPAHPAHAGAPGGNSASVHPSFRSKVVCTLSCRYCTQGKVVLVCWCVFRVLKCVIGFAACLRIPPPIRRLIFPSLLGDTPVLAMPLPTPPSDICSRGMKAILLADTRVELYSTDSVPNG